MHASVASVGRLSFLGFVGVRDVLHDGLFGPLRLLFAEQLRVVPSHLLFGVLQLHDARGPPGGDLKALGQHPTNVLVGGSSGMFRLMANHHVHVSGINLLARFGIEPGERDHGIFVGAELVFETDRWSVGEIFGADEFVARRFRSMVRVRAVGVPFARFDPVFHEGLLGGGVLRSRGIGTVALARCVCFLAWSRRQFPLLGGERYIQLASESALQAMHRAGGDR
mmetsp:Transcript_26288/g.61769  ORF Transcript_26288/g.61769 Transcript_26288/m.61769 type:complete len:224 (-) Transcript_26288:117-788(-)